MPILEKRHLAALLFLSTLPLFTTSGCKKTEPRPEKPVTAVQVEHPEIGPISEEITADAVLTPIAQAALQAKITAPVKTFYVQRGSRVHAGQVVAVLENRDLAAAATDNEGSYLAAKGAYTATTESTAPEELSRARLDVDQTKAIYELNNNILQSRTGLLAQGAIARRDVDSARITTIQAKTAYDMAQQHYKAVSTSTNTAAMQAAEGQLNSARGKMLGAQAQLSYTQLRSPINGVVTERTLFPGETAAAGAAVITVMDMSSMIAKVHIAQEQAQELKLGTPAVLTIPGAKDPVPASVSLISPALDAGSTTVEVWLKAPNPHSELKAGATVHATIKARTVLKAMLVPTEAIQRSPEGEGKIVWLVQPDGTAKKRAVTIGLQGKEDTQILDGLTVADKVITVGSFGLDDDTKIKVEAPEAKEGDEKGGKEAKDADEADEKAGPKKGEKE